MVNSSFNEPGNFQSWVTALNAPGKDYPPRGRKGNKTLIRFVKFTAI